MTMETKFKILVLKGLAELLMGRYGYSGPARKLVQECDIMRGEIEQEIEEKPDKEQPSLTGDDNYLIQPFDFRPDNLNVDI